MNKRYEDFLQLLKLSMGNEIDTKKITSNYEEILELASIHKVVPLIYEASYKRDEFKQTNLNFQRYFKTKSIEIIYNQIQRSEKFLQIYEEFNKVGLKVLVFKGIILRELYPIPEERISSDEDLLIQKKDLKEIEEILQANNMERIFSQEDKEDVYHYFCKKTGLHLELHTTLFSNKSHTYRKMDEIFQTVFDDSDAVMINTVKLNTFSLDKHFLYIIIHAIKHFISCGTGIRQICDIVMYINKYYEEINWDYLWKEIIKLGYDTLLVNLLQIGIDYLGLEESKIVYPKYKSNYYINTDSLIEDIMDGGIYGASTQERLNAANISLDAINKNSKSKVKSNLAAIFPEVDNLKERYKYLNNYPILLPIAWGNRILTYIKEKGSISNITSGTKGTISVGNKRIDLLKEYKLIQ